MLNTGKRRPSPSSSPSSRTTKSHVNPTTMIAKMGKHWLLQIVAFLCSSKPQELGRLSQYRREPISAIRLLCESAPRDVIETAYKEWDQWKRQKEWIRQNPDEFNVPSPADVKIIAQADAFIAKTRLLLPVGAVFMIGALLTKETFHPIFVQLTQPIEVITGSRPPSDRRAKAPLLWNQAKMELTTLIDHQFHDSSILLAGTKILLYCSRFNQKGEIWTNQEYEIAYFAVSQEYGQFLRAEEKRPIPMYPIQYQFFNLDVAHAEAICAHHYGLIHLNPSMHDHLGILCLWPLIYDYLLPYHTNEFHWNCLLSTVSSPILSPQLKKA